MGILTSDKGILILIEESTYGTDSVDTALNANTNITYLAIDSDADIAPVYEQFRPNRLRPGQDGIAHVMVADHNTWTINGGMRGGSGADHTPKYSAILKACGFAETVSAGTSTTYKLNTSNDASFTAYLYRRTFAGAHRLIHCEGALGNMSFEFAVKSEPHYSASGMAASADDWSIERSYFNGSTGKPDMDKDGNAVAYTGTVDYDTSEQIICQSITLTVGGTTYPVSEGTLDCGMSVGAIESMTAAQAACRIVRSRGDGANASGNLKLQMCDGGTALDDALTKWKASTEAALSIVLTGANQKITFALPKIQLTRPTPGDTAGATSWDIGYVVNGDHAASPFADNGILITYAAA